MKTDKSKRGMFEVKFDPLRDYLEYYKSLESPGYALLVTGDWGSGKTHQINSLLPELQRYYVSLFGIATKDEIYEALLGQMYPADVKAKKESNFWKDNKDFLGIPVGGFLSAAINRSIHTKIDRSRILVFDDFERSQVRFKTLLGVINFLIEHEDCKVVLIAHDDKVKDCLAESKEKVIGHTVNVRPQVEEAFTHFSKQFSVTIKKTIVQYRPLILQLFSLSGCKSLRVLRYVMASLGRLFSLLDAKQTNNETAMRHILSLFVAVSIEVQRGDLGREEISKRIHSYSLVVAMRSAQTVETMDSARKSRLEKFGRSYEHYRTAVEISSLELSDELLVDMLIDGRFDRTELQNYLEYTGRFKEPEDQPAWRRFMNFDSMSDDESEELLALLDRQFEERAITDIGELMHVWSIRLLRIRKGLLKGEVETQVEELKSYFDDLVTASTFPKKTDKNIFGPFPAYGGYVFWGVEENAKLIGEISLHFDYCEREMLEKEFPAIRAEIELMMKNDPSNLSGMLACDNNVAGKYHDVPALLSFPPKEFVDSFLSLPRSNWEHVRKALKQRRVYLSPSGPLRDEVKWFDQIVNEMTRRAEDAKGTLNGLRIERHIPV
jgi:hypothetical protein